MCDGKFELTTDYAWSDERIDLGGFLERLKYPLQYFKKTFMKCYFVTV